MKKLWAYITFSTPVLASLLALSRDLTDDGMLLYPVIFIYSVAIMDVFRSLQVKKLDAEVLGRVVMLVAFMSAIITSSFFLENMEYRIANLCIVLLANVYLVILLRKSNSN